MKKLVLVFLLMVFLPSLVLGWLAMRSLQNQELIFERQQTLLYQEICQSLAKDLREHLALLQSEFSRQIESYLAARSPARVAGEIDALIPKEWPLAEVGFAVSMKGQIHSPSLLGRSEARRFRLDHDLFLSNQESVEVYWQSPKGAIRISQEEDSRPAGQADRPVEGENILTKAAEKLRSVLPQKEEGNLPAAQSRLNTAQAEFHQLMGQGNEGLVARFLQDRLKLLMWYRSPRSAEIIYGAQLALPELTARLGPLLRVPQAMRGEFGVALLNEKGVPVAKDPASLEAGWRQPLVSVEVGEGLPHWEIAGYLFDATRRDASNQTLTLALAGLVILSLGAMGAGGWLVWVDLRRQVQLARQKTDFVSNVSHELKTPLTSIRMFTELLAEDRVTDEAKRRAYLQIVSAEVARLTRLINNVLDFSRMERGEKKYQFQDCNLTELVRQVLLNYGPNLESRGFSITLTLPPGPVPVRADPDAVGQVLVNLISNAEKYSGPRREIGFEVKRLPSHPATAEIRVLDRGLGVPSGHEERIFEKFHRAHDTLSSGVQGSGLGLTLARQIARAHGGDLLFERRAEGGSCFVFRLPLHSCDETASTT